jgi:hypothetical protein
MLNPAEVLRRAEQRKREQEPAQQNAPTTPPTTRQYPLQGVTKPLPLEK